MARKKKGAYGKRYSLEEKQAICAAWQAELWKASPMPKSKFCKETGISTITLDKWLETVGAAEPAAADVPSAAAPAQPERVIVVAEETRDIAVVGDDSVSGIIRAIKDHQASIDELKTRLRGWVDAL